MSGCRHSVLIDGMEALHFGVARPPADVRLTELPRGDLRGTGVRPEPCPDGRRLVTPWRHLRFLRVLGVAPPTLLGRG